MENIILGLVGVAVVGGVVYYVWKQKQLQNVSPAQGPTKMMRNGYPQKVSNGNGNNNGGLNMYLNKIKNNPQAMQAAKNLIVNGNAYAQQNMAGHAQYQPFERQDAPLKSCPSGQDPAAYFPYPQTSGASYDMNYPNAEDVASKYPRGPINNPTMGTSMDNSNQPYNLNIDSLMPASWRQGTSCASGTDNTEWSRYSPTKSAFNNYITASGSARLSMSTRSPLSRQVGISDLLRQGPPLPLSGTIMPFSDSSFRQDLIFNQLGRYPSADNC